jgi:acyl-CoA thioester hydrolase
VSDGDFELALRVYYEDTDALGIVYHANYLKFMERARTDWLRSRSERHAALRARHGVVFVVTRIDVRFQQPARLDDRLRVGLRLTRMGRAGFDVQQWVRRGEAPRPTETLCNATVRVACLDGHSMRPQRIPDSLLLELQGDH